MMRRMAPVTQCHEVGRLIELVKSAISGPPAIWLGDLEYISGRAGLAGSFVLAFAGARGCVFVTPKSERVAGRNSSRMSAPPVASSPPLSSCAQEFPADQIALDPVNVRSRRNSVVSALVDAAFVRPLRCKIRQLICLKVSLRENLDHLRCLASANQWRRADFGNDGQGIGAVGT